MFLTIISLTERIALIALVVGVITAIAAIVVIRSTKLKYGLLISLSVVVIGSTVVLWNQSPTHDRNETPPEPLIVQQQAQNQQTLRPTPSSAIKSSKTSSQPVQAPPGKVLKYEVKLVIPSSMNQAKLFVDDRPAVILESTLTVIRILVEQKNQPTRILLRKGEKTCEQTLLINRNVELTPCE